MSIIQQTFNMRTTNLKKLFLNNTELYKLYIITKSHI